MCEDRQVTHVQVQEQPLVPPAAASQLSLAALALRAGDAADVAGGRTDALVFVTAGGGTLELDGAEHALALGSGALVRPDETARLTAGAGGLGAVVARVAPGEHRHAPMGDRAVAVALEAVESGPATGSRSFQILFGPHNGCLFATLFVGYIPPGAAKLHYHLYDEIVMVVDGDGRLHLGGEQTPLRAGTAFRLRPLERHIVENSSSDRELVVLGVFTPAGSPSAAYLAG
jgi:quercetin dioxygenase-like cupin family protein